MPKNGKRVIKGIGRGIKTGLKAAKTATVSGVRAYQRRYGYGGAMGIDRKSEIKRLKDEAAIYKARMAAHRERDKLRELRSQSRQRYVSGLKGAIIGPSVHNFGSPYEKAMPAKPRKVRKMKKKPRRRRKKKR